MTSPARHGGTLLRLVLILAVVAVSGALAWTTLANHRAHGTWSFHPLDSAWWSPRAATPAEVDPFTGVANDAKRLADQAGQALWGVGGLVEKCETWWQASQAARPAGAGGHADAPAVKSPTGGTPPVGAAPAPPPAPPTTVRGLLEQRLGLSEQRFAEGIDLAKRARPAPTDDPGTLAGRARNLHQANACFAEVERDLAEAIPAYQAIPGHDVAKLASARQLQGFTRQMQDLTRLTP